MCEINNLCIVFVNGPGDKGSIPGRVIPKTQKWYLILLAYHSAL